MRKLGLLLAVGLLCLSLAACGQSGESSSGDTADQTEESQLPEMNETEEVQDEAPDAAEPTEPEPDSQAPLYEDNFSVDTEAVTAFAQKIQSVTAEQDLEGLADLIAYPVYVGFPEGGESVTSKEEFVALGAERIFTQELLQVGQPGRGLGVAFHLPLQGQIFPSGGVQVLPQTPVQPQTGDG